MPFGHDSVFETDRTDRVVLVHDAVVEDAEADGDASLAEQGSFDGRVATSSLPCASSRRNRAQNALPPRFQVGDHRGGVIPCCGRVGAVPAGGVIADRIGATLKIVQHIVGASRRPTGQRGALLWFRTGSDVVTPNAFRLLNVATTA